MNIPNDKTHLLILQSTSFCNIDCKYCYLKDRDIKDKFDLSTLPLILENLLESNLLGEELIILWHSGEPLVLPVDFYYKASEIIEMFSEKTGVKIHQHLQTNGILISQEHCDLIKNTGIKFGLSIDGPKFIHDNFRVTRNGNGTFDKVMKGVELLHSNNITFPVIAVLTNHTLDFPIEFIEFFHEIKVKMLAFNIDEIEGSNFSSSFSNSFESEFRFKEFISKIWKCNQELSKPLLIREFKHQIDGILNTHQDKPINTLTTPLSVISVKTNGDFGTFCPELLSLQDSNKFIYGNVYKNKFTDIYINPEFINNFREINEGIQKCKDSCSYFDICLGGTPSNKYSEHKKLNVTETLNCKYIKKNIADIVISKLEEIESERLVNYFDYYPIFN